MNSIIHALSGLALFLPCCAASAENAQITIRASTQALAKSSTTEPLQHFKERVEAASEGAIRVEIHASAELYGDDKIGDAVSSGAVELGFVNLSRYAERLPALDLFQQPFLFTSEIVANAARAPGSEIRRLIEQALLDHANSRVLWWQPRGQIVFLSHGFSVADPAEIRNKTVRTFGPTIEAVVSQCGGVPKNIGGQQQAQAYERRLVDVGMAGISTVMARKLWKSMDTITRTNHASAEFVNLINEKFWQGLSDAHKAIILAAARETDAESAAQNTRVEATAYGELAELNGIKIVDLTAEQLQLWRICSSDVLSGYVEKSGPLGHELMAAYGRLLQQPCCNNIGAAVPAQRKGSAELAPPTEFRVD